MDDTAQFKSFSDSLVDSVVDHADFQERR